MSQHDHDHDHEHDHTHDADTYYLDQICMVGISGAFGAVCLAMYFWQTSMLDRLLGPQFHLFVLCSGIALVAIALVRGATLWRQAGQPTHDHDHDHDHEHAHAHAADCGHEHGNCAHEHAGVAGHHHHHEHEHHHHGHDHDAADHEHGWAPWRYVLLLVPIILFLLGLPNKGPQAQEAKLHVDVTQEAATYAGLVASMPVTEGQLLTYVAAMYLTDGEVVDISYQDLESYAASPELRAEMQGKTVRVRGQFAPSPGSDHVFGLVRFRIRCCGADAIQLRVPMVTRDSLTGLHVKLNDWVKVTGVVDFQRSGGERYVTILRVMNLNAIQPCAPDSNPYIQ